MVLSNRIPAGYFTVEWHILEPVAVPIAIECILSPNQFGVPAAYAKSLDPAERRPMSVPGATMVPMLRMTGSTW